MHNISHYHLRDSYTKSIYGNIPFRHKPVMEQSNQCFSFLSIRASGQVMNFISYPVTFLLMVVGFEFSNSSKGGNELPFKLPPTERASKKYQDDASRTTAATLPSSNTGHELGAYTTESDYYEQTSNADIDTTSQRTSGAGYYEEETCEENGWPEILGNQRDGMLFGILNDPPRTINNITLTQSNCGCRLFVPQISEECKYYGDCCADPMRVRERLEPGTFSCIPSPILDGKFIFIF